jgi:hypothetical protein
VPDFIDVEFGREVVRHNDAIVRDGDAVTATLHYSFITRSFVVTDIAVTAPFEVVRELGDVVSVEDNYGFIEPYGCGLA